jgi:hypothetical protein
MKAIPGWDQPVLLTNVAKTNLGLWCVGAAEGTVIRITRKERRLHHSVKVATRGRKRPQQLKMKAKALTSS